MENKHGKHLTRIQLLKYITQEQIWIEILLRISEQYYVNSSTPLITRGSHGSTVAFSSLLSPVAWQKNI